MVFYPPKWVGEFPEVPDTLSICDFVLDEKYGRTPHKDSMDPYTCGLTGKTYTSSEVKERVDHLSRALAKEFGWKVNEGTEYDKVIGVFALNTIDIMTLSWAVHRCNGVSSPANAAYSADELAHQLTSAGAKCLFTVAPLLETGLKAAAKAKIPNNRVYICEMPLPGSDQVKKFKHLGDLIKEGASLPQIEPIKWEKGQGARQTAFLCYSSGTSGLPKGVMISHRNVISNTLQVTHYDKLSRDAISPNYRDVALGLLPQSHIYALVVVCHCSTYNGDQVIVLPKFDLNEYLKSIERFRINSLYIVPPIMIAMVKNPKLLAKYDLSSVSVIWTGAAPTGKELATEMSRQHPNWAIRQGYGLTETCTVVSATSPTDIVFGSSGCLISGTRAKLMSPEGTEVTGYDQPGELWVSSPAVVLGYLNNPKATQETFVEDADGRWMRTGDEICFRKNEKGNDHVWVVDRIKELIKVKGLQVAPAELEACLLDHPAVADCTVIPIPDDDAGELPKAYVVKAANYGSLEDNDAIIKRDIQRHVEKNKARHKWLKGGVEFIDVIPKSPSGKILRRLLRDKEKAEKTKKGARL